MYVGERARLDGHEIKYLDERWDSWVTIAEAIRWCDVLGISAHTGHQLHGAMRGADLASMYSKPRVWGGVHATFCGQQLIDEGYADVVVQSEGEEAFAWLIGNKKRIEGNWKKILDRWPLLKGEQMVPIVNEHTIEMFQRSNPTNDVTLVTSRGCPYACNFCYTKPFHNSKWRPGSLETWTADLDRILAVTDIKWLRPEDDWMGPNERVMKIGEILHERGIGWKPSIRAEQVTDELAEFLSCHGCTTVALGIETGSPIMLKERVNKQETVNDYVRAAMHLARHGVQGMYSFVLGMPGETEADRRASFGLADMLHGLHRGDCHVSFYVYSAVPGSAMYYDAIAQGYDIPKTTAEWADYSYANGGKDEDQAAYLIAGMHFQSGKLGKTTRNFPGWKRWVIRPFEWDCHRRWRARDFTNFNIQKSLIEKAFRWAAKGSAATA